MLPVYLKLPLNVKMYEVTIKKKTGGFPILAIVYGSIPTVYHSFEIMTNIKCLVFVTKGFHGKMHKSEYEKFILKIFLHGYVND